MRLLSKEDILSRDDLQKEEVYIPEWEASVLVSELSADARDEFEQFMVEQRDKLWPKKQAHSKAQKKTHHRPQQKASKEYIHIRAALAAATLIDESGKLLFSFADVIELGKKSGKALDRIFDVANNLNKIYGQKREDIEKNSEAPQGDSPDGE